MTNEEIEAIVTKGINEKIAKKHFLSSTEYTNAMNSARARAKICSSPFEFSERTVRTALKTDSEITADIDNGILNIAAKKIGKDPSQLNDALKKMLMDKTATARAANKKRAIAVRKASLDYCFLKCMNIVGTAFHNKHEASRAYANTVKSSYDGSSYNESYSTYVSEAYLKFMFMMQDSAYLKGSSYIGEFSEKKAKEKKVPEKLWPSLKAKKSVTLDDGTVVKPEDVFTNRKASFNFNSVKAAIEKNSGNSKIANYDYFNALQGRFYAELQNTNRDLLADETQEGVTGLGVQKSVTFKDASGKTVTKNVINSLDSTSFQTEKNGKDEEMSAEDSMEYKYMQSKGLLGNEIEADEATKAFMDKWEDCCNDVHYVKQGKPNRWSHVKKSADGTEKPNRKAKIFKYIIINALSQLGSASAKDLYNDFYKDTTNPKQKWDGEISGTLANGNKELSLFGILDEYDITAADVINACNVLGADVVLGKLKGKGSQLPDSPLKAIGTKAGKQLTGKVEKHIGDDGQTYTSATEGDRDLLNEMSLTKDGNKLFKSFTGAISKIRESNDWSDENVSKLLNENLKGGIDSHKRTWKTFSVLFDLGLNQNQRDSIYKAITK